jgi:hypothetical protein
MQRYKMPKHLSLIVLPLALICAQPLSAQTEAPRAEDPITEAPRATRTPVTEEILFFVDPLKGDDENPCISSEQPCKTMQAAYDKMYNDYDFKGSEARMQLADGDYTSGLDISGHLVGAPHVQVVGDCGNPQAVNVKPAEGTAFSVQHGGVLQVACVQVSGAQITGFESHNMGVIQLNLQPGDAVVFADMPGGHGIVARDGGSVNISGQIVISGNAASHWAAFSLSRITVDEGTIYSISDEYAIDYFLNMSLNSVVNLGTNVTFGGANPKGQKYNVTSGSRVSLNGNELPGTNEGTVDEGQVF